MRSPWPWLLLSLLCLSCGRTERGFNVRHAAVWTEFRTTDSLPAALLDTLRALRPDFRLADFDEYYQATDLVMAGEGIPEPPSRQIRYLARSGDHWWMTYRHGGFGLHYHFIRFTISGEIIRAIAYGSSLSDLDRRAQIDSALERGELRPDGPGGSVLDL